MTTAALPTTFTPIDEHLPVPTLDETPAAALRRVKAQAPEFREWFRQTGVLDAVATRSLVTLPYPRQFALWEASTSKVPYVWMTNRMFVVRWQAGGRTWTLLAEPSDYELGVDTPYLRNAIDRLPLSEEKALDGGEDALGGCGRGDVLFGGGHGPPPGPGATSARRHQS